MWSKNTSPPWLAFPENFHVSARENRSRRPQGRLRERTYRSTDTHVLEESFRAGKARPLGILWFFQNFQTYSGSFHVACLKTFEHLSAPQYASFRQDMLLFSDNLWY